MTDTDTHDAFEVMKHVGGSFVPQRAVITAETENGHTAVCLTIEEDQWLMRSDVLLTALVHAINNRGD